MSENDKKFVVTRNTPIGFGKMKGRPHKDLLLKKNKNYANWLVDQGREFRYKATREWIVENLPDDEDVEIKELTREEASVIRSKKLGELTPSEIQAYLNYLEDCRFAMDD